MLGAPAMIISLLLEPFPLAFLSFSSLVALEISNCNFCCNEHLMHSVPIERYQRQN